MNSSNSRKRSRSRSPEGIKMHVKNLATTYSEKKLEDTFRSFGIIKDVKIIRKGTNGLPLRDSVYGFVVMDSYDCAKSAMESLNSKG